MAPKTKNPVAEPEPEVESEDAQEHRPKRARKAPISQQKAFCRFGAIKPQQKALRKFFLDGLQDLAASKGHQLPKEDKQLRFGFSAEAFRELVNLVINRAHDFVAAAVAVTTSRKLKTVSAEHLQCAAFAAHKIYGFALPQHWSFSEDEQEDPLLLILPKKVVSRLVKTVNPLYLTEGGKKESEDEHAHGGLKEALLRCMESELRQIVTALSGELDSRQQRVRISSEVLRAALSRCGISLAGLVLKKAVVDVSVEGAEGAEGSATITEFPVEEDDEDAEDDEEGGEDDAEEDEEDADEEGGEDDEEGDDDAEEDGDDAEDDGAEDAE